MALTEEAKAELAAAIAIVREDRFEKYARQTLGKNAPKDPPKDPLIDPNPDPNPDPKDPAPKDPVNPPPPKDPAPKDPDPKPTRRSAYWGELLDD